MTNDGWRWRFYSYADVLATYDWHPKLRSVRLPSGARTHFATDYQQAAGVIHLGFTFICPVVEIEWTRADKLCGTAESERYVECEEGCLTYSEATLVSSMKDRLDLPSPATIARRARAIRKLNIEVMRGTVPLLSPGEMHAAIGLID